MPILLNLGCFKLTSIVHMGWLISLTTLLLLICVFLLTNACRYPCLDRSLVPKSISAMGVRVTTIYGKTLISSWELWKALLDAKQASQMLLVLASLECLKQKLTKYASLFSTQEAWSNAGLKYHLWLNGQLREGFRKIIKESTSVSQMMLLILQKC